MRRIGGRELARIERAVSGRLTGRALVDVVARVRGDAGQRAYYDRATEVMRALEGRVIASTEIDAVEHWLAAEGSFADAPRSGALTRMWMVLVACAAAALLVVGLRLPERVDPDERFAPKGPGRVSPLAIEALCDRGGGELVEASGGTCVLDGTLAFAAWLDGRFVGGDELVVFGIDADGAPLYYLPTPDGRAALRLVRDRWQPLPRAVELAVNHRVGPVRIYAAVTPRPVTVDEVDATVAAIVAAGLGAARPGDPDWIERLAGRGPIASMCVAAGECAAAELAFHITGDVR